MLEDFTNEDDEYYYDEALETLYERDFIMDDDSGITYGNVIDALRLLYTTKGHAGPYTFDEFYDAVIEMTVGENLKALINKGLIETVMLRDGEMGYKLTPDGQLAARLLEETDGQ